MTVTPGTLPDRLTLSPTTTLHAFTVDESSYLLVHAGHSLLIECHSPRLSKALAYRNLPPPELILHTHVQPEHCQEGDSFPEATIRVPAGLETLASDPVTWQREAYTVWEDPMDWGNTLGAEKWGVAGCITMRPPPVPLRLGPSLRAGERFAWHGLTIEALSLPAHGGLHALGLLVREGDRPLVLFPGDLLRHPAHLVNCYDLERKYGGTCLAEVPALLRQVAGLGVTLFAPATGPLLLDGPAAALALAERIDAYLGALKWRSGLFTPETYPPCPTKVGRFHRLEDGVYQFQDYGNTILLIDRDGHGLMVDPGPCDYDLPMAQRQANFHADLDALEREAGLKTIDLVLITHHHGDHYDLTPVPVARYGAKVAAWDLVARVVKAPWDFPYCCTLPWYNLGFEHVAVDHTLALGQPFYWHDCRIDCVHLPGHSYCHAGYLIDFEGRRIACTGDTIQDRGDAPTLGFIMGNHSVPGTAEGMLAAYRAMVQHDVHLNLGGHGSRFRNCRALYTEAVRRMEHVTPYLQALFPQGDFARAFRRPGFPRLDSHG